VVLYAQVTPVLVADPKTVNVFTPYLLYLLLKGNLSGTGVAILMARCLIITPSSQARGVPRSAPSCPVGLAVTQEMTADLPAKTTQCW
jgi:hypothetical protein